MRIAIHSVPRSGSTWLGSIFDSHPNVCYKYQPLFSYRFKSRLSPSSSRAEIVDFFSDLYKADDEFLDQRGSKERFLVPEFKKADIEAVAYKEVRYHNILANLLVKDDMVKVVGLIRNPLATMVSWFNAPKEFRVDLGWNLEEEWRYAEKKNLSRPEEFYGYDKWKEVTILFEELVNQYPKRFCLIKYNDLLRNPRSEVEKIFAFCELRLQSQTISFLSESKRRNDKDAYSVYKTRTSDSGWKDWLPDTVVRSIVDDLKGTSLESYLD